MDLKDYFIDYLGYKKRSKIRLGKKVKRFWQESAKGGLTGINYLIKSGVENQKNEQNQSKYDRLDQKRMG